MTCTSASPSFVTGEEQKYQTDVLTTIRDRSKSARSVLEPSTTPYLTRRPGPHHHGAAPSRGENGALPRDTRTPLSRRHLELRTEPGPPAARGPRHGPELGRPGPGAERRRTRDRFRPARPRAIVLGRDRLRRPDNGRRH